MRPFYRKDLFRDEILTSTPLEYKCKLESDNMKLETLRMEKGQSITIDSEVYEVGVVILSGVATVEMEDFVVKDIGERKDVFSGKPTAVYIPCETTFTIYATGYGNLEIVLCKVKTESRGKPCCVMPKDVVVKEQGVLNWKRKIHEIFTSEDGMTHGKLIIGETYGCPGSWATYPYEKDESKSIFYFKIVPNQSKQVQVMRDAQNPNAYLIQDGAAMLVQDTYIPIPEVEGCQIYYLWFKVSR